MPFDSYISSTLNFYRSASNLWRPLELYTNSVRCGLSGRAASALAMAGYLELKSLSFRPRFFACAAVRFTPASPHRLGEAFAAHRFLSAADTRFLPSGVIPPLRVAGVLDDGGRAGVSDPSIFRKAVSARRWRLSAVPF